MTREKELQDAATKILASQLAITTKTQELKALQDEHARLRLKRIAIYVAPYSQALQEVEQEFHGARQSLAVARQEFSNATEELKRCHNSIFKAKHGQGGAVPVDVPLQRVLDLESESGIPALKKRVAECQIVFERSKLSLEHCQQNLDRASVEAQAI